jgi:hypothetical protein
MSQVINRNPRSKSPNSNIMKVLRPKNQEDKWNENETNPKNKEEGGGRGTSRRRTKGRKNC